eukprot:1320429-Amorphochlora_amoeboformis.AAC.1
MQPSGLLVGATPPMALWHLNASVSGECDCGSEAAEDGKDGVPNGKYVYGAFFERGIRLISNTFHNFPGSVSFERRECRRVGCGGRRGGQSLISKY